jgi:hypothetical protein
MVGRHTVDGKTAILISPDWGGGWSSWADPEEREYLLFSPELIKVFNDGGVDAVEEFLTNKGIDCPCGLRDLTIQWVDAGREFRIYEYDGSERVEYRNNVTWFKG